MPQSSPIRAARLDDLRALGELERAAGAAFRDLGMTAVAEDDPPLFDDLVRFQAEGRAWVAVDEADAPIAYLVLEVIDRNAHIEQVSVHPSHARRGLGRSLVDTAAAWAAQHGLAALTLTTYAEVAWNAPYYQRLGFHVLPDDELTSGLRQIREHEATRGLDAWPRVTMRRPVAHRVP